MSNIDNAIDDLMNMANEVHNGNMKASIAYATIYRLEKACASLKDEIKDSVLSELDKYSKNDYPTYDGFRVSLASRSNWSYKDSILDTLKEQSKAREKAMQNAYAHYLKHNEELITPDGEIIPRAEKTISTYPKMEYVK